MKWPVLRYHPSIYPRGLERHKNPQDTQYPSLDSDQVPPIDKTE